MCPCRGAAEVPTNGTSTMALASTPAASPRCARARATVRARARAPRECREHTKNEVSMTARITSAEASPTRPTEARVPPAAALSTASRSHGRSGVTWPTLNPSHASENPELAKPRPAHARPMVPSPRRRASSQAPQPANPRRSHARSAKPRSKSGLPPHASSSTCSSTCGSSTPHCGLARQGTPAWTSGFQRGGERSRRQLSDAKRYIG
jgi:hypothetical protein